MKKLLVVGLMLVWGCRDGEKQEPAPDGSRAGGAATSTPPEKRGKDKGFWQPLVQHEIRDQTGAVFASMPFPRDWKRKEKAAPEEPYLIGPHGLEIRDYPLQSFLHTQDPQMRQVYLQSGQPLRPMPDIERLIQEDLAPRLAELGLRYVRHYEVPEVTRADKWYSDQLFKAMPSQTEIKAIGSEWASEDGKPLFVLLHLNRSLTTGLELWSYYCNALSAETTYFEQARKQFLFALANTHYPLEPIMAYNRREAERAGQSWAAHNQRMARNQAAFAARQRAFVNRSEAVNEAIMSGWKERDAAGDRMQERTIDGIYERTKVADPSTGREYKVEAGANRYWMNSEGEYIGTDRMDYDPNLDEGLNAQRWRELREAK